MRARSRTVGLVVRELGGDVKSKKIAVLGGAFKPDSDDVRDSPALDISEQLRLLGAQIHLHDPKAIEGAKKKFPHIQYSESIDQVLSGADIVLHLTEWKEYREIDPSHVKSLVNQAILIDGRNMLDVEKWRAAGWKFIGLGRFTISK